MESWPSVVSLTVSNKGMLNATKGICNTRDDPKTAMLGKPEGRMEIDRKNILCALCNHFVLVVFKMAIIWFIIMPRTQ